jgi:hypothetical protein
MNFMNHKVCNKILNEMSNHNDLIKENVNQKKIYDCGLHSSCHTTLIWMLNKLVDSKVISINKERSLYKIQLI